LVLVACLLAWVPECLSRRERVVFVGLAAFMIACQQSSLLLGCVLLALLGGVRWFQGGDFRRWSLLVLPPAFALVALCSVNLAAHHRFAVSPFGNVFLLARVIYDGPGMEALQRDCPAEHWRLCPYLGAFPPISDDFLWTAGSPLNRAGGAKAVSQDADAIIRAGLAIDPVGEARAAWSNTVEQLTSFASGDGLNAWPEQVSPWVRRDFPPREVAAYEGARQQAGSLGVPLVLAGIHLAAALAGVVGCAILLPVAFGRRARCFGFLLAVVIALPVSAAISGGLSAPHDRYQSRIMWLPPFVAVVSLLSLRTSPRSDVADSDCEGDSWLRQARPSPEPMNGCH
jgi:hypothetical protein